MDIGSQPRELETLASLEAATAAAQSVLGAGLWRLAEPEVVDVLGRLHRLAAQVASLQLKAVREVAERSVPATVGATNIRGYLKATLLMSPAQAGEQTKLAEALATKFAGTGAALASGSVSYEQAKAIVSVVEGMPSKATAEHKAEAEAFLLDQTRFLDAAEIRKTHKLIDEIVDPDGTPDREDAARKKRGANIRDNHDGTQTLSWTDIDENVAIAKAAIHALAAPVPGEDGERDPRSPAERRADALVDLCRMALDSGVFKNSRGVGPHLHVTFSEETLRGEPGAPFGRTSTGERLSPEAIQRLVCHANLTGILLNGEGVPLKVGRTERTVQPGQWIALVARDVGCGFPQCTRPAEWCQAHHVTLWSQDGLTDVDDMALFCLIHHQYLHHKGWTARMRPDGHVEVVPPPWVDPTQQPRRNLHWHLQREWRDFTSDPDP